MKRAVALGLATSLLASGSAFAFWTTGGSGTATSRAGTTAALTLTPGTPTARLHPGGSADVAVSIASPNSFGIHIGSLTLDAGQGTGGFGVDNGHSGCGLGALSFAAQTNGGEGWTVPAGGSLDLTLAGALSMSTAAANQCQGATFTVHLAADVDAYTLVRRTAGLVSLWRLGTAPTTADNFTGAAGTALAGRSSGIVSTWTTLSGTPPVLTDANRLRRDAAGAALVATSASPSGADYAVTADVVPASLPTGDALGVAARISATGTSWYAARHQTSDNTWRLVRVVNGVESGLASAAATLSAGQTYRLRLDVRGTDLTLSVNGTVLATASDATLTAAGRAGLVLGVAGSPSVGNATGLHADNFRVLTNTGGAVDTVGPNTGVYLDTVVRNEPGAPAGDLNGSVTLDGAGGSLRVAAPTGLPLGAAPRSVELWFKRTGTGTAPLFAYGGFSLRLTSATNLRVAEGAATRDFMLPGGTSDGAWHHVVVAHDGGTVAAYLDGVALGAQSLVLSTALDGSGLTAGSFAGSLDELAVYSGALSAQTVRDHHRAGQGS